MPFLGLIVSFLNRSAHFRPLKTSIFEAVAPPRRKNSRNAKKTGFSPFLKKPIKDFLHLKFQISLSKQKYSFTNVVKIKIFKRKESKVYKADICKCRAQALHLKMCMNIYTKRVIVCK